MRKNKALHNIVPSPPKVLYKKTLHTETNPDFVHGNLNAGRYTLDVFRSNVKTAITSTGMSVSEFFRRINKLGFNVDRCNFISGNLRHFPNILWCITFARLLGLDISQLFDASLPEKLKTGEVVVKIQFLPPKDGEK